MRPLIAIVLAACLSSCAALAPAPAYVKGDRSTFKTVEPLLRNLADGDPTNDPKLTSLEAKTINLTLDSWRVRIEKAEDRLKEKKP